MYRCMHMWTLLPGREELSLESFVLKLPLRCKPLHVHVLEAAAKPAMPPLAFFSNMQQRMKERIKAAQARYCICLMVLHYTDDIHTTSLRIPFDSLHVGIWQQQTASSPKAAGWGECRCRRWMRRPYFSEHGRRYPAWFFGWSCKQC